MIHVSSIDSGDLTKIGVRGICPHCNLGTTFSLASEILNGPVLDREIRRFVASYFCDICLEPIPTLWEIIITNFGADSRGAYGGYYFDNPKEILGVRGSFIFEHVPTQVSNEIREAIDCLSVSAYNAFAAMCRRAVQAICTDLGAGATTKIEKQIKETAQLAGLEPEWLDLMLQVMLTGHDGAHPHLPEVTADRAAVLLQLLQDLTHELYTRPGKVREAAKLRQDAIKGGRQAPPVKEP
jgi:hypothetical protein